MGKQNDGVFDFFRKIDMFGELVPAFNIARKSTIQTLAGAGVSLLVLMLTLAFGLIKIQSLIMRKNPSINTNMHKL